MHFLCVGIRNERRAKNYVYVLVKKAKYMPVHSAGEVGQIISRLTQLRYGSHAGFFIQVIAILISFCTIVLNNSPLLRFICDAVYNIYLIEVS